jgi:hypothetical protein
MLPAAYAEYFEDLTALLKTCEEELTRQKAESHRPSKGRPVSKGPLLR